MQLSVKILKNIIRAKKIWNFSRCSWQIGKYLASVIDDSVIKCDEIIGAVPESYDETTKSILTKKSKSARFYILIMFFLITVTLLIVVSIYIIKH